MLHGRIGLYPPSLVKRCCGAKVNGLLPVMAGVLNKPFIFDNLCYLLEFFFICHQFLRQFSTLFHQYGADMHGTTEAHLSEHSYVSNKSSLSNLHKEPLKGSMIEPYEEVS